MRSRGDNEVHYVTGTERKQIEATAVRANIKVMDSYVHPPGDEAAYGHVQLSDPGQYASMGWVEFGGNDRHIIARWYVPGNGHWYKDLPPAAPRPGDPDDEPFFAVWEDFATNEFAFFFNGAEQWRLPQDHPLFPMFTPNAASIHARISTLSTQMPGESSDRMEITNAEMRVENTPLQDFLGSERNDDSSHFGMRKINPRHYQTWDKCV